MFWSILQVRLCLPRRAAPAGAPPKENDLGTIWERTVAGCLWDVYEIPIFMNSVRLCHYDSNDDCYEKCYEHSLNNWKPTSTQKLLLMQGELQGNNCAAEHDRMSLILGISLTSTEGCSKFHDYHHLPIFTASLQVLSVPRATRLCCQSNNANKGRQVAPQVGSLQSSFVEKTYCSILVQTCKPNQELIL